MAFLDKTPKISNHAAALTVFFAAYIAAAATVIAFEEAKGRVMEVVIGVVLSVIVFMTVVFIISRLLRRTDVVDMAWGPAFVVAALAGVELNQDGLSIGWNVQTIITCLVLLWAARLAFVIFLRLRSRPEDKRYVDLRRKWKGNAAINTYLRIFVVQAILATIISTAIIIANTSQPVVPNWIAYIGIIIWTIGFYFETVGDLQLKRFLADSKNKGKLMTKGLWAYTRHPNYFGEATMWWGIFIVAVSVPYGWLGILTPVVITYLLLFVSGVPMTEQAFASKPGWAAYKKRTSKFFPLPPNK